MASVPLIVIGHVPFISIHIVIIVEEAILTFEICSEIHVSVNLTFTIEHF